VSRGKKNESITRSKDGWFCKIWKGSLVLSSEVAWIFISSCAFLSPPQASKGGAQILSQALSTAAQGNKEMLYKSSQGREDQLMPCFDNETADDYRD